MTPPAPTFSVPVLDFKNGVFNMEAGTLYIFTAQEYPGVPKLTPEQTEVLNLLDEITVEPGMAIEMDFRRATSSGCPIPVSCMRGPSFAITPNRNGVAICYGYGSRGRTTSRLSVWAKATSCMAGPRRVQGMKPTIWAISTSVVAPRSPPDILKVWEGTMLDLQFSPIKTAAAWRGDQLSKTQDWVYMLTEAEIAELEALGARFIADDPDLRFVQAQDYPLVECKEAVEQWGQDLDRGRGFTLVRGLRSHLYSDALSSAIYFILGLHMAIRSGRTSGVISSIMSMPPRIRPWMTRPPCRPRCATGSSIIVTART